MKVRGYFKDFEGPLASLNFRLPATSKKMESANAFLVWRLVILNGGCGSELWVNHGSWVLQ